MEQPISIFNIGQHAAEVNAAMFNERTESNLFDPRLKNEQETRVVVIRPIPNVDNVLHSMTTKRYYVFEDNAGKVFFDSKTTFNRPEQQKYEFCPVSDLWLKLRNSTDQSVKDLADQLYLQTASYAYVQIVQNPAEPAMNGKIAPMRLPVELTKLFNAMAMPTEQELALGTKPVQPFDIINGVNIKLTITGKIVRGTLMRDWKCEKFGDSCAIVLPLGPNGALTPVTQLDQNAVIAYLKSQETDNLDDLYGYKEPTTAAKLRVKNVLRRIAGHVPGLGEVIESYFPETKEAEANALAQPQAQAPIEQSVGQPAQPIAQPQIIQAGNPMATEGIAPQPAAQPAAQPEQPIAPQPTQPMAQPAQSAIQPAQPAMQPAQPAQPASQPMAQPGMQPGMGAQPGMQPGMGGAQPAQPAMSPTGIAMP